MLIVVLCSFLTAQASSLPDAASLPASEPASFATEVPATDSVSTEPVEPLAEEPAFTLLGGVGRVSGELLSRYAMDTRFEATSEDVFEWRNRAQLKLDYRIAGKFRAFIGTRFDLWVKGAAPFRDTFWLVNARNVRADGFFELREAYVDFYTSYVDFRIGNQVFSWGQNELFAPADMLNPVDLRDALASDLFKKPVPSVLATIALGEQGSLRLVWQPLFTANDAPVFGSDFSLAVPGRQLERGLANAARLIDPSIESRFQSALVGSRIPDANPVNSTVGARLSYQLAGVDMALSGIVGWNRLPGIRVDADLLAISQATAGDLQSDPELRAAALRTVQKLQLGQSLIDARYQRTAIVAFDAATTWRDFTFKADVGYQADTTLYLDGFTPTQKPLVRWVLGVEYNHGEDWSVWVSFFSNHVFGLQAGERLAFVEPAFQPAVRDRTAWWSGMIAIARAKLLEDRLELRLTALYNLTLSDAAVSGTATWNFSDYHHATLGGMAIVGSEGTLLGQLAANNQIYVQYRLTF